MINNKKQIEDKFLYNETLIKFISTSFWLDNLKILSDLSFDLRRGESIAFIGDEKTSINYLKSFFQKEKNFKLESGKVILNEEESVTKINKQLKIATVTVNIPLKYRYLSIGSFLYLSANKKGLNAKLEIFSLLTLSQIESFISYYVMPIKYLTLFEHYYFSLIQKIIAGNDIIIFDENLNIWTPKEIKQLIILINNAKKVFKISFIFFNKNLDYCTNIVDVIAVLKGEQIVELGTTREVLEHPLHYKTIENLNIISKRSIDKLIKMDFNNNISPPTFFLSNNHYVKTWIPFYNSDLNNVPNDLKKYWNFFEVLNE
ncbi:MAG: hypothetical protein GQ557_01970 [Mycoplasmataceae bacterium]|nr:hypothetical protein [Mycoplasmataceae bacterium]